MLSNGSSSWKSRKVAAVAKSLLQVSHLCVFIVLGLVLEEFLFSVLLSMILPF